MSNAGPPGPSGQFNPRELDSLARLLDAAAAPASGRPPMVHTNLAPAALAEVALQRGEGHSPPAARS